jgi:hypothetical protein
MNLLALRERRRDAVVILAENLAVNEQEIGSGILPLRDLARPLRLVVIGRCY